MSHSDHPDAPSPETGRNGSVAAAENPAVTATATATATVTASSLRLRLNPNKEHMPDEYEDLQLDFSPAIFSALERYLPLSMLNAPRDDKAKFMHDILVKYMPRTEHTRVRFSFFFFSPFFLIFEFFYCVLFVCSENARKLS